MASEEWVIAVRRDKRGEVPPDWVEVVGGTAGVSRVSGAGGVRLQVSATAEAIASIRGRLGEFLLVEPVMPRERL
jgi:hypothetical protein